jgi:hypothetical protein
MTSLNFPSTPSDGDLYEGYIYDSTLGVWNSNPAQIAARFVTSASAPENPSEGDGWFDSTTAKSYTYYDGVWVQIGAPGAIRFNQLEGIEVTDPLDGEVIVYDSASSQWVNESPITTFGGLEDTIITIPQTGDSLVYNGTDWVNGPRSGNAIINGDFGIWQRGTSFSSVATNTYTADRWQYIPFGGSATITQQAFISADIEAVGYGDAEHFLRMASTGGAANSSRLFQKIEDVRTFAGQQVTLSFWAKSDAARNYTVQLRQNFGSGGSAETGAGSLAATISLTTSWQKFSFTGPIASISGKTIGAGSHLILRFFNAVDESSDFDLWGVQLEAGPVATPFKLAGGGSKGAELALCQRYYYKSSWAEESYVIFNQGNFRCSTFTFPTTMRAVPSISVTDSSGNVNKITMANAGGTAQPNITPPSTLTRTTNGWSYGAGGIGGTTGTTGNIQLSAYTADAEL